MKISQFFVRIIGRKELTDSSVHHGAAASKETGLSPTAGATDMPEFFVNRRAKFVLPPESAAFKKQLNENPSTREDLEVREREIENRWANWISRTDSGNKPNQQKTPKK